jgi:putative protease
MEILAPAGGWEAMIAAVNAGADAIYLGGKEFNARQSAANFDREALQKAVDFLHVRGCRMYVTFNTLVAPEELEAALEYAAYLRQIGVDAIILQDLGLLRLIHETLPDLGIHASTQMTIHDLSGVKFLQEFGVRRVVLAREMNLKDIRAISTECDAELEVFVHGALCVSYSGACLFSSMVGGRSGNRGRCAQPCRLEYELLRNGEPVSGLNGSHLLSPKDLCLIDDIPALAEAGVFSLKIEGRMKSPDYVGTVVRVYRDAVERWHSCPDKYHSLPEHIDDLTAVFNRGLTTGYLHHDISREGMSPGRPSNRGQFLGRVVDYETRTGRGVIDLQADLLTGDGIEFWVTKGGRLGQLAEDLRLNGKPVATGHAGEEISIPVSEEVFPGDRVFRTSSVRLRQEIRNNNAGKVPCIAHVYAAAGERLRLAVIDPDGLKGEAVSDEPLQRAVKHPITLEVLSEQLGRLGETPFYLVDIQAELFGEPMVPLSLLNKLRREAVAKLEELRISRYNKPHAKNTVIHRCLPMKPENGRLHGTPRLAVFAGTVAAAEAAVSAGAERVYFGGEELLPDFKWGADELRQAVNLCHQGGSMPIGVLPRITRPSEWALISDWVHNAEDAGVEGILVCGPGQMHRLRQESRLPLFADAGFNIFNPSAVILLLNEGVKGVTLSPELTLSQATVIWETPYPRPIEFELLVHGALELMISQFCPVGAWGSQHKSDDKCTRPCGHNRFALRDRKGYTFDVWTDQFCRAHVMNSADLALVGDIRRLANQNLILRLQMRERSPKEVYETVKLYQKALERKIDREELVGEAKQISGRSLTRGHYFRGVE